jgi:colanic acid/amylovoran biosynthesis glycosyltransferase
MHSTLSLVRGEQRESAGVIPVQGPRVGYLVTQYPATSHTFILREVLGLRKLGFCIETASINAPDRTGSDLTRDEQFEMQSTMYVKRQGPLKAAAALFRLVWTRPRSFFSAFLVALRIGNGSARDAVTNFCYFGEAALLGTWLEQRQLKHLHVHFANAASTVAMITARAYPITFSMSIHGPDEFYEVSRHALREKTDAVSFICCIGSYARSQLMKVSDPVNWPKYRLAPLGVDPTEFHAKPFRPNPPRWEILCVGRLTPAKGQLVLLQALTLLVKEGRSVHCRFIGDGPGRRGLAEFAARELPVETVTFQGSVIPDSVRDYLYQADLFVLPSFAEGIPVSLMEAMSMEIPCISTLITGIPELIRDGIDGLLVSPSDAIELAKSIGRLMDDADLRYRLGIAGRGRVLARFNLPVNVRALAEIMRDELSKT